MIFYFALFFFSILSFICFFRSLNLFDYFFFCGIYSVFSWFLLCFYFLEFVLESVDCFFFQLLFDILLNVWDFFRMFQILFARIATFRSSPLRSITGLFNDIYIYMDIKWYIWNHDEVVCDPIIHGRSRSLQHFHVKFVPIIFPIDLIPWKNI